MARLVLASESPRRREILASAGFEFEVAAAGVDESAAPGEPVSAMALRLARAKSLAVSRKMPGAWVIGADTMVDVDGEPFSKPRDRDDAMRMLRALNGRPHLVHTGVSLARGGAVASSFVETTKVTFGELRDRELFAFADSGLCDDKAGAYAIQGRGALMVERIEGCYYNVVGLPLYRLKKVLEEFVPELFYDEDPGASPQAPQGEPVFSRVAGR
jgi:septum formation protein